MLPGSEHDSDRIDRAIDDVARQMTERATSADLKARVLARIERQDSSAWLPRLTWLAAPVAAAILLIVFLWPDRGANRATEHVKQAAPVARTPDRPPTQPQD